MSWLVISTKKETITGEEFMNIFTRDDGFAPTLPKTQE